MSATQLVLPPLELSFGEPFNMDNRPVSMLSRASTSISVYTLGSQPSLRSSLRSSTRGSERSSLRSVKSVRFCETTDRKTITPEYEAPTEALPVAHLPIDGILVKKTNSRRPDSAAKRFSMSSIRLPLQDTTNKQPIVAVTEASSADFEAWLAMMETPQRPKLAPRVDSKDSDRMSALSKTKSNRSALSLPAEKEKKSRRKSWINLLAKV
nr:hypothetical protein B0A51_01107 [Rachicladosporium sp. CCFEE 5018]